MIIYMIWEMHHGIEPRLKTAYLNRKSAYRKVEQWNKWEDEHEYFIKEFEVRED